jgi:hypothetical protein
VSLNKALMHTSVIYIAFVGWNLGTGTILTSWLTTPCYNIHVNLKIPYVLRSRVNYIIYDKTLWFIVCQCMTWRWPSFGMLMPCSLLEIDRRFRGAYCLRHQGDYNNEGNRHLWNVGQFLINYTALISQKTAIFILSALKTWNLTMLYWSVL